MNDSATRRTGSNGGRPRKAGPRHGCGKIVQPRAEERLADVLAFAAAQPHRAGSTSPLAATLIGRLLDDRRPRIPGPGFAPPRVALAGYTAVQLNELADRYLRTYGRWQSAQLSRRPFAVIGGAATVRAERTPEQEARAFETARIEWASVSKALRQAGQRVADAFETVVLHAAPETDERLVPAWAILSLPEALRTLAAYYRVPAAR